MTKSFRFRKLQVCETKLFRKIQVCKTKLFTKIQVCETECFLKYKFAKRNLFLNRSLRNESIEYWGQANAVTHTSSYSFPHTEISMEFQNVSGSAHGGTYQKG